MTPEEFRASLPEDAPPDGMETALQALWRDAKGDWKQAHRIVQSANDANSAWVHAYLHRKEGDVSNAKYWYSRVGREFAEIPLEAEWERIVEAVLTAK